MAVPDGKIKMELDVANGTMTVTKGGVVEFTVDEVRKMWSKVEVEYEFRRDVISEIEDQCGKGSAPSRDEEYIERVRFAYAVIWTNEQYDRDYCLEEAFRRVCSPDDYADWRFVVNSIEDRLGKGCPQAKDDGYIKGELLPAYNRHRKNLDLDLDDMRSAVEKAFEEVGVPEGR